ncbi:hypothetical protein TNIN_325861 [Trichonephila inaurata madagascariensis]|uniref:Uncharacterized protein n=1 Tax=Trichonephila inaurata madagascariensis TaxID=2747483 RepID=A0A8X6MEG0_9ARAC|nr:hypothetical protein TNIN_325861 [Trichonephila inaurata madagascariensis]
MNSCRPFPVRPILSHLLLVDWWKGQGRLKWVTMECETEGFFMDRHSLARNREGMIGSSVELIAFSGRKSWFLMKSEQTTIRCVLQRRLFLLGIQCSTLVNLPERWPVLSLSQVHSKPMF